MSSLSKVKTTISSRLPKLQQVASVYAIIVLFVYGWTIYWYLWKLPSWLDFMTASELLAVFAYSMVVNFLESLFVLILPIALSLILPVNWFRDQFVARGVALVVVLLTALLFTSRIIAGLADLPPYLGWIIFGVILVAVLAVHIFGKVGFLRRTLEEVSDRAVIFLYVSVPVSAVSLIVVVIRNLLAWIEEA
jgi:hypothetical protein